ncbi:hypothetical protein ACFVAJ_17930 [Agromyces sp. NPDC057679]|uniref:hypothetical protein n=1 Tax=Agromyces sp. NPDC057679 TaxID=3346207 RepID=UPI003672658A
MTNDHHSERIPMGVSREQYEPFLDVAPDSEYEEQLMLWQELKGPPAIESDGPDLG